MDTKIIQITSGRGPTECTWVVAQVLKKVLEEAKEMNFEAEVIEREAGEENGTIESAFVKISGTAIQKFIDTWTGTILWIGKSQFRKFHKRKNWFIGVFEIANTSKTVVEVNEISYQAVRSSGAGGQNVNKVNSAVRATHLPTGITVLAMDSRSQHQNKKLATERLLLKLQENNFKKMQEQFQNNWLNQMQIERGNPKRIFEGTDFKKQKESKNYKAERQRLKNNLQYEIE